MEPRPRLAGSAVRYARHRPEEALLYQLVERHYPAFLQKLTDRGRSVPAYVEEEFEAYLNCGRLEQGFLRVRCTTCHAERLVAFSCKRRGFCPSCGARRMTESAALLVDAVLPREPIRQWVLSVPFPLRFLFAADPAASRRAGRLVRACWSCVKSGWPSAGGAPVGRPCAGPVVRCEKVHGRVTFARPFRWPIAAPARGATGCRLDGLRVLGGQGFCSAYTPRRSRIR